METMVEAFYAPKWVWIHKTHWYTNKESRERGAIKLQYNRAYPNAEDIRVMVKKAIAQEHNSMFYQCAVLQLLQEEKDTHQLKFFFRQRWMPVSLHTVAYIAYCIL